MLNARHIVATPAGLIVALAAAPPVHAGFAGPGDVTAYFPVTVQESQLDGYDFEFVIVNCTDAVVNGIYVEEGWDGFFSDSPFDRNLRQEPTPQNATEGAVQPPLAGWMGTLVSYESDNGAPGLHTGGTATIAFIVDEGLDIGLDDLNAALGTDGYGFGLRTSGLFGGEETRFGLADANSPFCGLVTADGMTLIPERGLAPAATPTPTAAALGLAMLGLAGMRRRRGA